MAKLKLHPFNYLLIPLISIIGIFCSHSIIQYMSIFIVATICLILFTHKINYKVILWFGIGLIPSLAGYLLANIYFNNSSWHNNLTLMTRIACLSSISFIYVINIDFEVFLVELMRRKFIGTHIGFALLATNNALVALKQEFNKIQLSYQMRYGKKCYSPAVIIPLLVAASRYAHNISISLHSRGVNKYRSFYRDKLSFNYIDIIFIAICFISILLITKGLIF